jgi:hypothetical protein
MAAVDVVQERVPASASPVEADGVATLRMTISVALLTAPNANGNLRLEAPHGMVPEGAFCALRYYVHGRARRSVVQALRVVDASAGRDLVTVRLISDTAVVEREARREQVRLGATAHRGAPDARAAPIELTDGSRSGLGFSAAEPYAVGERVWIRVPRVDDDACVIEVEVVRADPTQPVPYGARFCDLDRGASFFAVILDAIWRRPAKAVVANDQEADPKAAWQPEQRGGMHGRRRAS